MLILPAIDLRGGKCVRLKQGDYAQETVFGDDPVGMARRWVSEGARALHLVDLDGAKAGKPVNGDVIGGSSRRSMSRARSAAGSARRRTSKPPWTRGPPASSSAPGPCKTRAGSDRSPRPIRSGSSSGWTPGTGRWPPTAG